MKKIFLLIIVVTCIIASCSKDDRFNPGQFPDADFIKGYHGNVHFPVISVPPDQDGDGNDTEELLAAIAAAEPGSVIKLTEGIYHLGYLELFGFEGTIAGAGKDKTIISPAELIATIPQVEQNFVPTWLKIIGGDVTISDLTIKTGDGPLISDSDPWYNKILACLLTVNNYNVNYFPDDPPPMNFTLRNVDFLCGTLEPADGYLGLDYNVLMALWIGTDAYWPTEDVVLASGKYNVVNCYFKDMFQGIEGFSLGEDAVMTADRNKTQNNACGMYFTANYNSRINISNNTFKNSVWYDVSIEDTDWGLLPQINPYKRCEYTITGNNFNQLPGTSSVVLKDYWGVMKPDKYQPMLITLKNNRFNLVDGSIAVSCLNSVDAQIRNNIFKGTANTGIYVDGVIIIDPWTGEELGMGSAKNALILGNNFTGFQAISADIHLGANSSNCTVVGNGKDSVIDEGTGNKIVAMKKKSGGHHPDVSFRNDFRMHGRGHH